MKKKIFIAAAVIISSTAEAQDSTKLLNEVVVTAAKFPIKSTATGKVVTIITKDQLEKSGAKDLAQILNEQTGVTINGANSNLGKDKSIYLRGARPEHTLILIDGVPVYDPSGIGSNFDIRNIATANVERIEVLKGSQSTLYGSDAIAGVINIITNKSINKAIGLNGVVSAGSNNTFKGSVGISGKKNNIDYNIGYNITTTKGINEAVTAASKFDKDGYTQNGLQVNVGVQLTKKIRINPYVRFTNNKGDIDQGAFIDELDYAYTQKSTQAGFKSIMDIGKNKLNILYNYNTINRNYIDDSIKSQNGYDKYSKGKYSGSEHFAETYAIIDMVKNIKLTVGTDFRSSVSNQAYSSIGFYGPNNTKYSDDSLNQNQVGVYATANITPIKNFNIELGNRLNIHSEYGSHYVFNINPSYLIQEKVKLFANVSSGYRTPSLYQLFSEYGNPNLKPEAAVNLEAGFQYFSASKNFVTKTVIFNRAVKDVIAFYTNYTTFKSYYINRDKQKDYGVELEATYTGFKHTNIKLFYNYVNGNITTKTGAGKDTTYYNLLRRPKHNIGLNIGCQITKRLYASTSLSAFSKREDKYFDAATFVTVDVTLKNYALLNLYAHYSFLNNKLKLFADLQNLTNTNYVEVSGFNTLGININGGVRYNF
ncbi:MAG: TonB-dependent receptor [Chitinophagaceae bacterium]|nr:TonB-dependent receptor [Chitinophagaceae bacterium]